MMQLILYSSTLISSFIFMQMNHPLAMGLMLLIQTLKICLMTGNILIFLYFMFNFSWSNISFIYLCYIPSFKLNFFIFNKINNYLFNNFYFIYNFKINIS